MKIEMFGKNYNISDSLKAITEKKCKKLDKYFADDQNTVARFNITLDGESYVTDLSVNYHNLNYRATAKSATPFDNLDAVIPRLQGQIRKQKDSWSKTRKSPERILAFEE